MKVVKRARGIQFTKLLLGPDVLSFCCTYYSQTKSKNVIIIDVDINTANTTHNYNSQCCLADFINLNIHLHHFFAMITSLYKT